MDLQDTRDKFNPDKRPEIADEVPLVESDDLFLNKRPINLVITFLLLTLALCATVLLVKDFYRKRNEKERQRWESGRLNKSGQVEAHDLFQPLRTNWNQYISCSLKAKPLKGSTALISVTISNKSPYPLANVVLNVFHLNWNGEVSKIESVMFTNIASGVSKTVSLNSVNQLKDVAVGIKSITAPAFNFCYLQDIETEGKADPYFCPSTNQ